MNRREALRNVAILMGGAISATTLGVLIESCNSRKEGQPFTTEQEAIITELADTIIPPTTTPGAKAAGVGTFITMMIKECYPERIEKMFVDGLEDLEKRAKSKFSNSFVAITADQRTAVLQSIVDGLKEKKGKEVKKPSGKKKGRSEPEKDPDFFQLAKELTMLGYFTSDLGAHQALEYSLVPGKYEGCTDVKPGQKAWAL